MLGEPSQSSRACTYIIEDELTRLSPSVCTKSGDRVPGPRSYALMSPVEFPWRDAVDVIEEVGSSDSYRLSLELSREGLICGPSSGFNLQGLYNHLSNRKLGRTLDELRSNDGKIHCVFVACDLPYQYLDEYFSKLGEEPFHPLNNQELLDVDLHRYDEAWEVGGEEVLETLYSFQLAATEPLLRPGNTVLDLRTTTDFEVFHLPGSISRPLHSLSPTTTSPFSEPTVLVEQWKELESVFDATTVGLLKQPGVSVWLVCYDGNTSRVATSVLRAKGVIASSMRGGLKCASCWSAAKDQANTDAVKGSERSQSVDSGLGVHAFVASMPVNTIQA